MSTETEKLKLFKWDTSNEVDLESDFDIEKTLNENWDKIDDNTEEVSKKNIEQDNSISELQEEIENLRNISNIMPSVNQKGENITLNNTAKNVRFRKFEIGGNSEQETREGYNLLNANLPYTTSSSGNTIKYLGKENIPKLEVNKYYYLHGKFSDGTTFSGAHAAFVITNSMGQILNKTFESSFQNTVDISNATDCYIYTDSTYVNKTVTEVAIYEGKENKAYEQHGAMPSIDYPAEIKTIGNNVNLFNFKDKKDVNSIYTMDDEGWITCKYDNRKGTSIAYLNYCTNNLNLKTSTLYNIIVEIKEMAGTGRLAAVSSAEDSQFYTGFNVSLGDNFADAYNSVLKTRTSFQQSINGLRTFVTFNPGESGSITFRISVLEDTSITTENFVYSRYNQGCTKIVKANKNLAIKKDKVWYNSKTQLFEIVEQGNAFVAKVKENATITINKKNEGNRFIIITSENEIKVGNKYSRIIISNSNTDRKTYTFNTNEREKYVFFGYYLGEDEAQKELSAEDVQIEISSTATKYAQHEEQSYIMPVQNEMLEGDYFDWNNEEEVHGWKKIILNGTENWQLYSAGTNISRRFGLALTENVPFKETEKYGKGYSTHFEITQFISGDLSIFLQVEPNNWYIAVTDVNSKWSSIVEFKSWLKAKYDAGTPVIIYYKTATETRLKFTDEQKVVAKEIQKATSYEDTTHIYSTDEVSPIFDVEAVADISKLINGLQATKEEG